MELSGSQLDGIETTTDGVLTESTVSFWIKPTDDTFAQENVIMEYFANIGYSVSILPNGTLQFDVVDNSPYVVPPVQIIHFVSGAWNNGGKFKYDASGSTSTTRRYYLDYGSDTGYGAILYDTITNLWSDDRTDSGSTIEISNGQTITGTEYYDGGSSEVKYTFTNPYVDKGDGTVIVGIIYITSGAVYNNQWRFINDSSRGSTATKYIYALYYNTDGATSQHGIQHDIQYDTETQEWSKIGAIQQFPKRLQRSGAQITAYYDVNNTETIYAVFTDPFYVAP